MLFVLTNVFHLIESKSIYVNMINKDDKIIFGKKNLQEYKWVL